MSIDDATPAEWDASHKAWRAENNKGKATDRQEGGDHYKDMPIQPIEFIGTNEIGFMEGNIIKYICRHSRKGGAEDVKKAIHYAELLLQTKYGIIKSY